MQRIVLILILFLSCACKLQAQVWTNIIDSVSIYGQTWFNSAVVDHNTNTLYLGGSFFGLNKFNTNSIIKFDGSSFDTLQSGLDEHDVGGTTVRSMQMFQNKLYVFGDFFKTGKYYCNNIGRWNGTAWDTLNFRPHGTIWFSDVYNNELYVAGAFDSIGGIKCNSISKFDGTTWHDIGHPISPNVITAIKNFNGRLYMAGQVTQASSSANLSYYDGTEWVPWVGVSGDNAKYIAGMTVIDTMLYVYGRFNSIAGTSCRGLAAYNGKNWYGYGHGLSNSNWERVQNVKKINGEIYVMGVFNYIEGIGNPNAEPLYTNMAKFDGEKWCLFSPPSDNQVDGLIEFNNNMYLFGAVRKMGNDSVYGFLKYNGGYTPAICSPTVQIYMSIVGLTEQIVIGDLKIYPNPVKDQLKIEFSSFDTYNVTIQLYNSVGQLVRTIMEVSKDQEINLSDFAPGMYFLKVQKEGEQKTFKIIKE